MSESAEARSIVVNLPEGGYEPETAAALVRAAGWVEAVGRLAKGPFGVRSAGTRVLEELSCAVDLGRYARTALESEIATGHAATFDALPLSDVQRQLLSAFQLVVTGDEACRRLAEIAPLPEVRGELELEGLAGLLLESDGKQVAKRQLQLGARFVELELANRGGELATEVPRATAAFLILLARAVRTFASKGPLAIAARALGERELSVQGHPYEGLERRPLKNDASGLLPVEVEGVVGNREYLEAGLRLARDVAGYDLDDRKNPKRINPILFGLGSPGCGKTLTAHAIGNYFLRYCSTRGVPAKFLVVRRSDWASSYQNASAANLIRIFREEVYGFAGVTGVYWPDIDTALASRDAQGLREEEKQNLGAVFGLFDGTLIPKDGKWFLICDANTTHMDSAAISRIAQNPFTVSGPTTAGDYARLLRDIMLKDVAASLSLDEPQWQAVSERLSELALSGRNVEAIANNIRAHIQDFEYPDEYFSATHERRRAIVLEASRTADVSVLGDIIERFVKFGSDARAREQEAQFQREVEDIVRRLNAGQRAAEQLTGTPTRP